ncbi:hypothetical protein PO909_024733 [Leuciscus waleckii]
MWVALKRAVWFFFFVDLLTPEPVQSASLSLQRVHNIHGGDGLSLGVFSVSHSITNDVLQKHLQHTASLFIDQARNTLDAATSSKTTNSGFSDSLDIIAKNLSVTLSASFPESFTAFSSSRHDDRYSSNHNSRR